MATKTKPAALNNSVIKQIDQLNQMLTHELRKKWKDLFGADPGQLGRAYIIRRLAYRIQELVHGGLSREARKQFKELAQISETTERKSQPTNLQVGTRLLREWHGQKYEIVVQSDGFLLNGKTYRSLSAVARAITGRHCGGRRFFGLKPSSEKRSKRK